MCNRLHSAMMQPVIVNAARTSAPANPLAFFLFQRVLSRATGFKMARRECCMAGCLHLIGVEISGSKLRAGIYFRG